MCFIGIYQQFCFDQCFLDFGEDFQEYLIRLSRRSSDCKSLSTLFYHMLWKRKNFVSLGSSCYFAPMSFVLILGKMFVNN